MAEPGIEFETMPDDVGTSVRRYYRIPVSEIDEIDVLLNGVVHGVSDINQEGVGILCRDTETLLIGETLSGCSLCIGDETIPGLTGRVIHRSSHISGQWHFGIQWLDLEDRDRDLLVRILGDLKHRALKPADIT